MKWRILTVLALFNLSGFAQKTSQIYFIANDSINKTDDYIISRLIFQSKQKFNYPANIEIFTDSAISNFGFIELQYFDTVNNKFKAYQIIRHIDKIEDAGTSINSDLKLNVSIDLLGRAAFKSGLYRARVKVFFSKYNNGMHDVFSNWSFFYIN